MYTISLTLSEKNVRHFPRYYSFEILSSVMRNHELNMLNLLC
jgi:hypothetical protein